MAAVKDITGGPRKTACAWQFCFCVWHILPKWHQPRQTTSVWSSQIGVEKVIIQGCYISCMREEGEADRGGRLVREEEEEEEGM